jgi:AcrR family transcriptional regulator
MAQATQSGERKQRAVTQRSKPRRTNAERSAIAQRKLIDAALKTLYLDGYQATTTDQVARRANVSRGAMLHHFPSRADLIIAVAEYVLKEQARERRERLDALGPGPQRFFDAADISWEIQKQPATIALLEIMLASRSDRALKKRLAPLIQQMSMLRTEAALRMMSSVGINDMDVMIDLLHIHLAALRGLAIDLLFTEKPEEVERSRNLLTRYEHTLARELMGDKLKADKTGAPAPTGNGSAKASRAKRKKVSG